MSRANTGEYFPLLDALRVFAAISVLVLHLHTVVGLPVPDTYPLIWFRFGLYGVEIFFAISGAVILQALLAERQRGLQGHRRRFMWRRWWRIAPLLIVTGAFDIWCNKPGFFARPDAWEMIAAHLAFVHNCFMFSSGGINGPSWTLGLEMQFYLLAALCGVVLLGRRYAFIFVVSLAAIGLIWRAFFFWFFDAGPAGASPAPAHFTSQLPGTLDGFAGGMLAILGYWRWGSAAPRRSRRIWAMGLGLVGLIGWILVIETASANAVIYWQTPVTVVYLRALIALSSAAWVAATLLAGQDFSGARWLREAGKLTYGIYLWHMPVLVLVLRVAPDSGPLVQSAMIVGLTFALAVIGWRFVEKPAIALGRRLNQPFKEEEPHAPCPRS
ncbi:MAG: acyltransferase family protein [Lysobacterales bacterium]